VEDGEEKNNDNSITEWVCVISLKSYEHAAKWIFTNVRYFADFFHFLTVTFDWLWL